MDFKEHKLVREVVVIYQYDNFKERTLYHITENIEDAYDVCKNFLLDDFQMTKEEVLEQFALNNSDYLDLFNPTKITSDQVNFEGYDFKSGEYFFRIWKTNTIKVVN